MAKATIEQRVARGVKFMNTEYGRSWLRKIDPEALALADNTACVIGQVEGEYCAGVRKLGLEDPEGLGFDIDDTDGGSAYAKLTRTWKKSIVKLQKLFKITYQRKDDV